MLTQGVNHPNANRAYPHALDGLDNFSVELLVNEMDVLVDDRQRVQELEGWGFLWVTSRYRWGAGGGGMGHRCSQFYHYRGGGREDHPTDHPTGIPSPCRAKSSPSLKCPAQSCCSKVMYSILSVSASSLSWQRSRQRLVARLLASIRVVQTSWDTRGSPSCTLGPTSVRLRRNLL